MLIIDDREHTEHPEIDTLLDIPHTIQRLDSADFAFLSLDNCPIGIERCEINNFVQKLRSGELESQLRACSEAYSTTYLLIEGIYDQVDGLLAVNKSYDRGYFRNRIYPHTFLDTITASLVSLMRMGLEVIWSANFECSMRTVKVIYKQHQKPEDQHSLFKSLRPVVIPTKLTNNPAVPKLLSLCNRMPEKVAILLINKYGSIWKILNTPDKELMETEGMGKTLVNRLKEGVGKNE